MTPQPWSRTGPGTAKDGKPNLPARAGAARRRPSHHPGIEDSRNGLLAAINAGLRCVVTLSSYTQNEDMREAALVVSSLGDPGTSVEVFANRSGATPGAYITLTDLV